MPKAIEDRNTVSPSRATARKSAASREASPASNFLDDMRALATAPHPDQALLLACDRFLLLCEERDRLYKKQVRGYMNRVRETMAERNALEVEIANTPARTAAGRRAKTEAALYMLGVTGTWVAIRPPALRDFMCSDEARA